MVDLAIVIVNYNTRDELRDCLQSLQQAVGGFRHQVIIVDNCSTDGSAAMVRSEHPWVHAVIESEHNSGYAFANNVGLRAVGYGSDGSAALAHLRPEALPRYVLLLNPDTVVPSDALLKMLAFMDANPDGGVAGPKLVREDGSLDKACRRSFPTPKVSFYRLSGLARIFPKSRRFGRYNLDYLDVDAQADVDSVAGSFMLIRSEALEQAGPLDEAFFMYGEDLDLCYRIKQHGWRVLYYPEVTVLHIKGASSRKSSRRAIAAFYDAMRIFHRKHYRSQSCFLANWLIDLGVVLLCKWALLRDRLRPAQDKRVASAQVIGNVS
ncbi:MAG: glycosyltransferase family 2 protein [Anaerolineales bacterium]|nr:MAG: glycosyltransferase family 2 protein [Anaerolineales bacterium]